MAKIIIGVHGLANKPTRGVLKKWWLKSIQEGLAALGYENDSFEFELVYWAHLMYPKPQSLDETDPKSPLFIHEPYLPSAHTIKKEDTPFRRQLLDSLNRQLDKLATSRWADEVAGIANAVLSHYFRDLDIYYSNEKMATQAGLNTVRKVVRQQLAAVLKRHAGKDILLISHSMGSIIAYDTLTLEVPKIQIDSLVTLGSPLGIPVIAENIWHERHPATAFPAHLPTPDNIKRQWDNMADPLDRVALDMTLADDFLPNVQKVRPKDLIVHNDYVVENERNPHKVYGYLRTPELSQQIHEFLQHDRHPIFVFWQLTRKKIRTFFMKRRLDPVSEN